jgi:hypothetical protein
MKNTFSMRTATAHDLMTRLPTILAWLEAGEEVVVKPRAVKPAVVEAKVDWSQSAASRDRTGEGMLNAVDAAERAADSQRVNQSVVYNRPHQVGHLNMTHEELQEFYEDMRGSY